LYGLAKVDDGDENYNTSNGEAGKSLNEGRATTDEREWCWMDTGITIENGAGGRGLLGADEREGINWE
jgi:hypothetical protein